MIEAENAQSFLRSGDWPVSQQKPQGKNPSQEIVFFDDSQGLYYGASNEYPIGKGL
jgi:hypothetical protein